jgi:hypothetical protein
MRKLAELARVSLCPACGKRPIGVKESGMCGPCHMDTLRAMHDEEIARIDSQRALWASRAKLSRRRRAAEQAP